MRLESNNSQNTQNVKNPLNNLSTQNKILIGAAIGCVVTLCAAYAMGYFSNIPATSDTSRVGESLKDLIAKKLESNEEELTKTATGAASIPAGANPLQQVTYKSVESIADTTDSTISNPLENFTSKDSNDLQSTLNLVSTVGGRTLVRASELFLCTTIYFTAKALCLEVLKPALGISN